MKKILVTGGAGYIGSHLARGLIDKGYVVRVLDSLLYGRSGIESFSGEDRFELCVGDICNIRDVFKAVKGVDAVIALAAIVGDPACALDKEETLFTNYESTKILVEACNHYKVRRLVFASSCSVYGANSELVLNEGSKLNPVSLYAETRIMSEQVILQNARYFSPVILRLATVFGLSERMRFDLVVNIMTIKALKEKKIQIFGGEQWRPLVHAKDAAQAFMVAMEAPDGVAGREVFNIGSNEMNFTITQVGKMVCEMISGTQLKSEKAESDKRDYRVNFEKANKLLGFKSRFSIQDGVQEIARAVHNEKRFNDYLDDIYYNVKYLYK